MGRSWRAREQRDPIAEIDAELKQLEPQLEELRRLQINREMQGGGQALFNWPEAAEEMEKARSAEVKADQIEKRIELLKKKREALLLKKNANSPTP